MPDRIGCATATWQPSPNYGERRDGRTPSLIVVHYTAMHSAEAALSWLCAPEAGVSSHYLIGRHGELWQMVDERDRAWHAGAGAWHAHTDVNSASVGIEIDNLGNAPFSEGAMTQLDALIADIMKRWRIGSAGVIGHSDCSPGRKIDPGPRFDWRRLERQGLAFRPSEAMDPGGDADALLRAAGYTADAPVDVRLQAFRQRHRTGTTGPMGASDRSLLHGLAVQAGIDAAGGAA